MSEEEKKSIEELKKEINKPLEVPEDKFDTFILYNIDNAKIILNLIEKQQKEIKDFKWKENEQKNLLKYKTDRIEKQQKEIERQGNVRKIEEKYVEENFISKDKIRHIRDKLEVMDYYTLNDAVNDLNLILGEKKEE